jgi:hypothetical protein
MAAALSFLDGQWIPDGESSPLLMTSASELIGPVWGSTSVYSMVSLTASTLV